MDQQSLLPEELCYLLDSNVIMELTRRSFTPQKFPDLHRELEKLIIAGQVRSVREVLREFQEGVIKQADAALRWCLAHESMFMNINDRMDAQLKIVSPHFKHDIVNSIRPYADPHLVAYALTCESIIVTHESSTPSFNAPKIPEIAAKLGTDTCDIWRFFKDTDLSIHIKNT